MLNHGTVRISVPAGRNAGWAMPASKALDEARFYTPEEIEEMMNSKEEPKSTWPREQENNSDSESDSDTEPA